MPSRKILVAALVLFFGICHAQRPAGFQWIDLSHDSAALRTVRHALKQGTYTDIRRIGILNNQALVMTINKNSDPDDGNEWRIFNISLSTGKSTELLIGYDVHFYKWIGKDNSDLVITYKDCWGCEAATVLTTFYFKPGSGWLTRWPGKDPSHPQPGAVVEYGDAGEPYSDYFAEQIFAILNTPDQGFEAGSWLHQRHVKTGQIIDSVVEYSIDPSSGNENIRELKGKDAIDFERRLCLTDNIISPPSVGQNSNACLNLMKKAQSNN